MAQTNANQKSANSRVAYQGTNLAVAMTTGADATMYTLQCFGLRRVWFRFAVTVRALTAFKVNGRFHPDDGTYSTLASAAADFTTPRGIVYGASGDLTTLAVGSGWLALDVQGLEQIQLVGRCATDNTGKVDVYCGASS